MSNTSATGGYLLPTIAPFPGGLTLQQYLQEVFVGITGLPGESVRPKFQVNPPKQPSEPEDNWIAFSIATTEPDANPAMKTSDDGLTTTFTRHLKLFVGFSIYGEDAPYYTRLLRDGLQIAQNRDKLTQIGTGFVEAQPAVLVPELVGLRWFQRIDMTIVLRQQINSTYEILSFTGAEGLIKANNKNNETINVPIEVEQV